ncbi:hypothetical protein [Lysinibacter cavernae]|uniref:hypothetical protein n=1 Tax=Lysinibacter cavernae TaxID=1640652 RepID=UPI0036229984
MAAVLATVVVASSLSLSMAPGRAEAATMGYGFEKNGITLGSLRASDGALGICVEPAFVSTGVTVPGVVVDNLVANEGHVWVGSWNGNLSVPAISGTPLLYINYIVANYGVVPDAVTAAAANVAVWRLRGTPEAYIQATAVESGAPYDAVSAAANDMITSATQNAGTSTGAAPSQDLKNNWSFGDPYVGSVTVPAGWQTVTLTNAVFEDGTSAKTGIPAQGGTYKWIGTPPDDQKEYRVGIKGSYTSNTLGQVAAVTLYSDASPRGQDIVAPTGSDVSGESEIFYSDPLPLTFSPVVSTVASNKIVKKGDFPTDKVSFGISPSSETPWRRLINGEGKIVAYSVIKAKGTLYGPSLVPFTESATVPKGTPVAGHAEVSTSREAGPGTIDATSNTAVKESGYYTWVWEIDYSYQDDKVKGIGYIPKDYKFVDAFGQTVETHVSPFNISATSKVSKDEAGMFTDIYDTITVKHDAGGGWLYTGGGTRVPVVFRGDAYWVEGDVAPEQQSTVPEDAVLLGSRFIKDITEEGSYDSEMIRAPFDTVYVTWVWSIDPTQMGEYAGYVSAWSDDFGIPDETTKIVAPKVSSIAQTDVPLFDPAHDTSIVDIDELPATTVSVTFEAFKKAVAGEQKVGPVGVGIVDDEGEPVLWTKDELAKLTEKEACVVQPVFDTLLSPLVITEPGEHDSPEVTFQSAGDYYWVDQLLAVDPASNETVVVYRGECGLENEKTTVLNPKVTTTATPEVEVPGEAGDVAHVEGPLTSNPDITTELTFELYKQPEDGVDVCENDNLVFDTNDSAITITKPGDVESYKYTFTEKGTYYWVETLSWTNKESGESGVFHRGKCGEPGETTVAKEPVAAVAAVALAMTGSGSVLLLSGLAAALMAAGATVLVVRRRRLSEAAVIKE